MVGDYVCFSCMLQQLQLYVFGSNVHTFLNGAGFWKCKRSLHLLTPLTAIGNNPRGSFDGAHAPLHLYWFPRSTPEDGAN